MFQISMLLTGLVPGHVLVVPVAHDIPCVAAAKDDTASEVRAQTLFLLAVEEWCNLCEMPLTLTLNPNPKP